MWLTTSRRTKGDARLWSRRAYCFTARCGNASCMNCATALKAPLSSSSSRGEEKLPGGASRRSGRGVLENRNPLRSLVSTWCRRSRPAKSVSGKVSTWPARMNCMLPLHGKGGHGAMPHLNIDPGDDYRADPGCLAADRQPLCQAFTSHCAFVPGKSANGATNVIPDKVCLEGTFRTLNENGATKLTGVWNTWPNKSPKAWEAARVRDPSRTFPRQRRRPDGSQSPLDRGVLSAREWKISRSGWLRKTSRFIPSKPRLCFYRLGVRNEAKGIYFLRSHPNLRSTKAPRNRHGSHGFWPSANWNKPKNKLPKKGSAKRCLFYCGKWLVTEIISVISD